jgi:uncharacterized protein YkwD
VPPQFALPLLALAVLVSGCSGVARNPPPPLADRPLEAATFDGPLLSRAIFQEVNRVRVSFGLAAVGPNRELDAAADEQASHLVLIAGVEHANFLPGEETPRARVARVGIYPPVVGENALMMPLFGPPGRPLPPYTYRTFAALLVEGWMNSPGHRANILERDFRLAGVATRLGRSPRTGTLLAYAVQVFIVPNPPGAVGTPAA